MNRKVLYGYQIRDGGLTVHPGEAAVVGRVFTLYMAGASYQQVSDTLNSENIPFSQEAPLWNKHKVKRLLENPRYIGEDGYPSLIDRDTFQDVQHQISEKTAHHKKKERPTVQDVPNDNSETTVYRPSEETVRLTNAVNRALEHPDAPENVVSLILQGISARYACCQPQTA